MSLIELSDKFKTDENLSKEKIIEFVNDKLYESCRYQILTENEDQFTIKGRVYESFLTPVTNFTATFTIKKENSIVKIKVRGETNVNWIFWLLFIFGLIFTVGIVMLIAIGLYLYQNSKPKETISYILDSLKTEFEVEGTNNRYEDTAKQDHNINSLTEELSSINNSQSQENQSVNFNLADELKKLHELKEKQIITDEEFQNAKKKLI